MAAQLGNLLFCEAEIEPQQDGRGLDAGIEALRTALGKSQHALVEKHVTRIYFDKQVGAIVDASRMDIRDMKQGGQDLLGAYASIDGKLGEFADSAILRPDSIDLLAIQLVDKQADDRIEPNRDRRNRLVTVARGQGDAVG